MKNSRSADKILQDQCLRLALASAKKGGQVALKYFRRLKHVNIKLDAGLVSEADKESEVCILKMVKRRFPTHAFLGEEGGFAGKALKGAPAFWVVDPLDGTTNYVHGFPFFCVSIGVHWNGKVQVGVVHAPLLKYTFTAMRGRGAFLNGKPISVSLTKDIGDSLLATGFSYKKNKVLKKEIRDFSHLAKKSRGIRRAGSAAMDLCMVAMGVFDGFWERELAPWDTAAGSLMVEEAGGRVTNFEGEKHDLSMKTILAGNGSIHRKLIQILNS